jgi:hypothetical protein
MKKLIAIILTLSILTACETSAPFEQSKVELTTSGVVTTVEVEETNAEPTENLCGCEVCENGPIFEKHLYGHDVEINVRFDDDECSKVSERLELAERAVKLLVDLDNDFDETIEKNEGNFDMVKHKFSVDMSLTSISEAHISDHTDDLMRIIIFTGFYGVDRRMDIYVAFSKEDDKWVIDSVFNVM